MSENLKEPDEQVTAKWVVIAMVTIAAGFLVYKVFETSTSNFVPTNSTEWAAWVQAVGSIGAIFIAVLVARRQAKDSKQMVYDQIVYQQTKEIQDAKNKQLLAQNYILGKIRECTALCEQAMILLDDPRIAHKKTFLISLKVRYIEIFSIPSYRFFELSIPSSIVSLKWYLEMFSENIEQTWIENMDEERLSRCYWLVHEFWSRSNEVAKNIVSNHKDNPDIERILLSSYVAPIPDDLIKKAGVSH